MIVRLALLALAAAALPAAAQTRSLFDGADPSAERIDGDLWIYPTGNGTRLQAWREVKGRWRPQGDILKLRDIAWVRDGARTHYLWAPDLVQIDDAYLLYYSIGPQNPTPSRIGVATCTAPEGPCTDSGRPLLTGGNGFEAIDPMVFTDSRSGTRFLYAGGSDGARLRAFILDASGMAIAREVAVEQPPYFTEGAFMHERGGVYYLSYSYGRWNTSSYSVHYATAPTPTGPWEYRGVLLKSDGRSKGPGHHSFVDAPDGSTAIVYHRWDYRAGDGPYDGQRRIVIGHIWYTADGSIAVRPRDPG